MNRPVCKRTGGRALYGTAAFTHCEYETNTIHFWVDAVHKELAVICLLNPFRVQYFPRDHCLQEIQQFKDAIWGVKQNETAGGGVKNSYLFFSIATS